MEEAKPCPFCGSKHIYMREGPTFRWVVMQCADCDATCGESRKNTTDELTLKDALKEWNTRTAGA